MSALFVAMSVCFLIGVGLLALYAAVAARRQALTEKLDDLAIKARVGQGLFEKSREMNGFGRLLLVWAARRLPEPRLDTPKGERLLQTLVQAGYTRASAVRVFQVVRLACSAAGAIIGLVGALAMRLPGASVTIWLVAGAALGAFAPNFYIARRARKRQQAIARQLSDVLDLLVVCVEAGLGLHEAIKIVGREVELQGREIGRELTMVATEMAAGKSLGQALRAFADRTAVQDIKPLAATLIQSEQLGAQVAPTLRASSDQLRSQRRLRAEEEAQRTVVKILFPLVLFVLPAMLIVIVGPALVQVVRTLSH